MKKSAETKSAKSRSSEPGILSRFMSAMSGGEAEGEEQNPKATDLLKREHDEVRALFKDFKNASEGAMARKKTAIDQACQKLEVHARLEESIFYPACRNLKDADARRMVGESLEEHLIVKRLVQELKRMRGADERFQAKATVLMESVEHHADEEESDLFPPAEREFGDEKLEELGRKMQALKARLTSSERSPRTAAKRVSRSRSGRPEPDVAR